MLVLRIENTKGEGCYSTVGAKDAHDRGECPIDDNFHPGPFQDERLAPHWRAIMHGYSAHPTMSALTTRFGFLTVGQYHRWFYTAESRDILSRAFEVSIYLVPDDCVAEGDSQCLFDAAKAKRLDRFPCNLTVEEALACVQTVQWRNEPYPTAASHPQTSIGIGIIYA